MNFFLNLSNKQIKDISYFLVKFLLFIVLAYINIKYLEYFLLQLCQETIYNLISSKSDI